MIRRSNYDTNKGKRKKSKRQRTIDAPGVIMPEQSGGQIMFARGISTEDSNMLIEKQCTFRCIRSYIIALLVLGLIAGSLYGLIAALNSSDEIFKNNGQASSNARPEDKLPQLPPKLARVDDPFEGRNPNDIAKWNHVGKSGLRLNVLNSLEDHWDMLFYVATNEWNSGSDAVALKVERIEADKTCGEEIGYLKVCNGNYGATNWRGLNQILMQDGYIIASVAKLNEYYLEFASDDRRQYTMCHEIGHGLGLGHTDEIYNNADLGDCMDYTDTPENNKRPGKRNFETLRNMYGTLQGGDWGRRRRMLRGSDLKKKLPEEIHFQIEEARLELENMLLLQHDDDDDDDDQTLFRNLQSSSKASNYSKSWNLGNGYQLYIKALLVV
mmetsp:Transcript_15879/g.23359  ORF Transcript_15879/g.23359 Transcript_15879/m.23359 type:complete len:383 (-) Transcript_15879:148-1296(-)